MEVTYELTQKDFYDSFIAHRNRSALSKWSHRALLGFAYLFVGIGMIGLVARSKAVLANFAPLSVLALVWIGLLWGIPWWAAKRQYIKQPSAKGSRTMVADDAGIRWTWNGGSAEMEWRNFARWREAETEFLLYSSFNIFNPVPKRALTSEQLSEFRNLLQQKLPSRSSSK